MKTRRLLALALPFLAACFGGSAGPAGHAELEIADQGYEVREIESMVWQAPGSGEYHFNLSFAADDQDGELTRFHLSLLFPDRFGEDGVELLIDDHPIRVLTTGWHCGGFGAPNCDSDLAGAFSWNGTFGGTGVIRGGAELQRLDIEFASTEPQNQIRELRFHFDGELLPKDCQTLDHCRVVLDENTTAP
jgi:hypothetical protein